MCIRDRDVSEWVKGLFAVQGGGVSVMGGYQTMDPEALCPVREQVMVTVVLG